MNRHFEELMHAWTRRQESGLLERLQALRVFHGPGEGTGEWSRIAIDRFGDSFWVTEWGSERDCDSPSAQEAYRPVLESFFQKIGASNSVALFRPEKGLPPEPIALFGNPSAERFQVSEEELKFRIQLLGARHPGLFLDHYPLRTWLKSHCKGLKVLNTFSYTGSLSVAAACGGASHVTTLDLSNPILQWAKENWALNGLGDERGRFIKGDYFEWLPRLKKSGERFDCVILDPPSFSRGTKGFFSTSKDLKKLHREAFSVLSPKGYLVTSINSANVPREKFEADVLSAAKDLGISVQIVQRIRLPEETFPVPSRPPELHYLKGLILRISSGSSS